MSPTVKQATGVACHRWLKRNTDYYHGLLEIKYIFADTLNVDGSIQVEYRSSSANDDFIDSTLLAARHPGTIRIVMGRLS